MKKNTELLSEIIKLMKKREVKIETPYDVENWLDDNTSHSDMFKTGLFDHMDDDDEEDEL